MRDLGWIEGRNIQVDYRFTDSSVDSIKKNVAEVIALAPDVIVANSTPVIAALRPTTNTIPIVLAMMLDSVGQGFVSNLLHPGANITGFYFIDFEIVGKWINLLTDVKPGLSQVALMFNPDTSAHSYLRSFKTMQQPSSECCRGRFVDSPVRAQSEQWFDRCLGRLYRRCTQSDH